MYLLGLILDGRRKSMVPMAERLGGSPAAAVVHHLLDLGLHGGTASPGGLCRRPGRRGHPGQPERQDRYLPPPPQIRRCPARQTAATRGTPGR
ncbi:MULTISPECIES: hypothetical protein [unclassified Streptosporangium]|uniref:hypothetical protein n=1 Tax=unclassified Streptosporangium TaxID=2632669 RepID=UPI003FA38FFB